MTSDSGPGQRSSALEGGRAPSAQPPPDSSQKRTPLGVLLWFAWAFVLLAVTGLLLPKIISFVDFSERAPFSLLGVFMMAELATVIFGITVALQRKRIAWRFAMLIALLPAPILAGLPPAVLGFGAQAATGWYALFVPIGLLLSVLLVGLLVRRAARDYFVED
jgi:hypothetical protein